MRIAIRIVVILLLTILVVGCPFPKISTEKSQVYSGPERPKEEIAVIKWTSHANYWLFFGTESDLTVLFIDGQSLNSKIAYADPIRSHEIYVLPGIHEVEWSISKAASYPAGCVAVDRLEGSMDYKKMKFEAKAGHTYKIDHPIYWYKGSVVKIIDEATGEVVASYVIQEYTDY